MKAIPSRSLTVIAATATLALALDAVPVAAHTRMVTPAPRDQQDGYKDPPSGPGGPCGISRAIPPQPETPYAPGQALTVEWSETINHPGCFVVDFAAADDANFQILGVKSHAGAAGGTPRAWSLDVTLPDTPCTACTLRVRQLMLAADLPDAQCPPATIAAGQTYYSCANVTLAGGAGVSTGGSGGTAAATSTSESGCGCATAASSATRASAALVLGAALLLARYRRRPR